MVIRAYIAQSVEHVLGKDEVIGSSPIVGSIFRYKKDLNQSIIKYEVINPNGKSGGKNG